MIPEKISDESNEKMPSQFDYERLITTTSPNISSSILMSSEISIEDSPSLLNSNLRLRIDRNVYDHQKFDEEFNFINTAESQNEFFKFDCSWKKVKQFGKNLFPPIKWLPKYKKIYLIRDIIVGLTICVLSIPQAMAYATLANIPAVVGLYSSFFPTLLYALFGTSRHIMYGMFAVPALMVGAIVEEFAPLPEMANATDFAAQEEAAIKICATITFCLGIIFAIMAFLQLHILTAYLSNHLVTGFTTAASFHVLASQLPKLISVKIQSHMGFFKLGYITYDLFKEIPTLNWMSTLISIVSITFLMIGKYFINPEMITKFQVPVPFELILVITTTLLSHFFNFHDDYGVGIVETIPTGVPPPKLPDFSSFFVILPKAIPIAVVIFGVTLSVLKLFAKKHDYKVNPAQDLRAIACIHIFCSFFSCHPGSGSLSRSAVASQLGSKSQIAGITSASVVLIVLLWAGPFLYDLPRCVLASIIFVALQSMFVQVKELPKLWKTSKIDFAIWMVSFLATFFYDVSEGLLIAVGFALFTVIYRIQTPKSISLAKAPGTELYRDIKKYRKLETYENILILRYDAPLLFINSGKFVETATKLVAKEYFGNSEILNDMENNDGEEDKISLKTSSIQKGHERYLIVDLSTVSQIDQMGVEALKELHTEVAKLGTMVLIAAPKSPVRELFDACGFFSAVSKNLFFPSIHDAVLFAQSRMNL
uniref:STAS domain-containing protein n=1 Tax=Panagrolaimus sp. PS1159 TaxID=55785 RepID=A0AC35F2M2_9BILA